jgi:protein-S-isoprenylcysteine O-methyltransferase Ste14
MNLSFVWQTLYWAWFASEIAILVVTRTRVGGGKIQDRGSLWILWVVFGVSITFGAWFGETHTHTIFGGAHWVRQLSLVVLVVALVLRWTAILSLGKSFSANVAIRETQTVHKTGLFRFVRHPSYLGLLLIFVARGLYTRNWIGFGIVLVPSAVALMYRIHVEEIALRQAFGEDYVAYSRRTKRLVPWVY